MRMIAAILLIVVGMILAAIANLLHFSAEADLLEKRPEMAGEIYIWGVFRRHRLIEKRYMEEFPNGKRARQFWQCAIAGFASFLSGVLVLMTFK
jgi:hypothetical protein